MNELLLQAVAPANLATRVPESGRRAGLGRLGGAPDISLFSEDGDMSSSGSRPRPSQYPVTGPRVSEVPTCAAAHRFLFFLFFEYLVFAVATTLCWQSRENRMHFIV